MDQITYEPSKHELTFPWKDLLIFILIKFMQGSGELFLRHPMFIKILGDCFGKYYEKLVIHADDLLIECPRFILYTWNSKTFFRNFHWATWNVKESSVAQ